MANRTQKINSKKSDTNRPSDFTGRQASQAVSEDAIAALAYQLWLERGCLIGSDEKDWYQAERELRDPIGSIPTAA
jgi:nucleoside-specific outer membrane channel protein Tsx